MDSSASRKRSKQRAIGSGDDDNDQDFVPPKDSTHDVEESCAAIERRRSSRNTRRIHPGAYTLQTEIEAEYNDWADDFDRPTKRRRGDHESLRVDRHIGTAINPNTEDAPPRSTAIVAPEALPGPSHCDPIAHESHTVSLEVNLEAGQHAGEGSKTPVETKEVSPSSDEALNPPPAQIFEDILARPFPRANKVAAQRQDVIRDTDQANRGYRHSEPSAWQSLEESSR